MKKRKTPGADRRFAMQRTAIAAAVWLYPAGVSQSELAGIFGHCPQVLKRILDSLVKSGDIIETTGDDKRCNYYMQGN